MKQASLYFKEGSSNKEYHIQLKEKGNGYVVEFQYGRVGNALQTGTKTAKPVSLGEAEKVYNKLYQEKTAKGYQERSGSGVQYSQASTEKKVLMLPQLLNTIEDPQKYIDDPEWIAQEKFDGERRGIISDGTVVGTNKKGTEVGLPLHVINALAGVKCTLDGEMVGDKYYAFDILKREDNDLKDLPIERRLEYLDLVNLLFANYTITVVKTAYTKEEKQALFDDLKARNAEGIVFKKVGSKYKSGRPNSGGDALKFKFVETATCRVKSHTDDKRSVLLEMIKGEPNNFIDLTVEVGKVTIPPNKKIPDVGKFVEVRYLYAYEEGCLFQPVYLGERTDCDKSDISTKQLKYKA